MYQFALSRFLGMSVGEFLNKYGNQFTNIEIRNRQYNWVSDFVESTMVITTIMVQIDEDNDNTTAVIDVCESGK